MNLEILKVGYLECNCYILKNSDGVLVIDPGDEYEKIKNAIGENRVFGILVTHNHFDHIGCVNDIIKDYQTSVYDISNLEEKEYNIGGFKFNVIYTFGHKDDCITFYFKEEKVMFTGDFLFYDTVGRCDLEGGNYNEMMKSIDKIKKYDKDITIYPGHGISTTLGREIDNNSYLF